MKKLFLSLIVFTIFMALPLSANAITVYNDNLLLGKTYTHNGTDWYADRSTDTDSTFLTDGAVGGRYPSSNYYGVKNSESPDIRFDFSDSPITFSEIHINFIKSGEAGITLPNFILSYKPEKTSGWVTLYMGDVTDDDFILKSDELIKAYGLKFNFLSTGTFVFVKEIMAYGYETPATCDRVMEVKDLSDVISVGKEYTNTRYVDPLYPDTGNSELTDGVYGTFGEYDEWTGTIKNMSESGMAYDVWPLYTTVIDLEKLYSVSNVQVNFLRDTVKRISQPQAIRIYASEDGENWMKIAYLNNIFNPYKNYIYTYGWKTEGLNGNMNSLIDDNIKARYIRVDFEPKGEHSALDEITVTGTDDLTGAVTLYNLSKLENGEVMKVSDKTGYIRDMALCYQHTGEWTKERYKPIITYIDKSNNSVDMLYDAVLFLAQTYDGRRVYDIDNEDVTIDDWHSYLDMTFGADGDVATLNEAAKQASIDLNDPDFKTKYVVMIPYPAQSAVAFGELNGRSLDLSNDDDAKYLLDWYIDEVCKYVENSDYPYLEFKGLYWMNEYPSRPHLITYANETVREKGYLSYWIPYFYSTGYFWREDLGFDALTLQPNHFFKDANDNTLGAGGTKIIETVAKLGAYGNFGVEMEFDTSLMSNLEDYNKALDYLNAAVIMGFDGPDYFRNWYLGGNLINEIAYSKLPDSRNFYDYIYELMNGTYEIKPYLTEMNDNLLRGLSYTHNVTNPDNWYKDRSIDADCTFLTDGLAGGNFYGNRFLGVKNQDVTVEFNFDSTKAVKELHTYVFEEQSSALYLPQNLNIYAKNNNGWVLIYSGAVSGQHTVIRLNRKYYTDGLKFEFTRQRTFLFIKEIMAFEENTDIVPDFSVTLPCEKGDINEDGIIDINDVDLFKCYFADYDVKICDETSDINGDGKITRIDLLRLMKGKL